MGSTSIILSILVFDLPEKVSWGEERLIPNQRMIIEPGLEVRLEEYSGQTSAHVRCSTNIETIGVTQGGPS